MEIFLIGSYFLSYGFTFWHTLENFSVEPKIVLIASIHIVNFFKELPFLLLQFLLPVNGNQKVLCMIRFLPYLKRIWFESFNFGIKGLHLLL